MTNITRRDVCRIASNLWLSRPHRQALKYRLMHAVEEDLDLNKWASRYNTAVQAQTALVRRHAPAAIAAITDLDLAGYNGAKRQRRRKTVAAKLLRNAIKKDTDLVVPADLSRELVETYL